MNIVILYAHVDVQYIYVVRFVVIIGAYGNVYTKLAVATA